ncbi:F-box protein SKIP23-like isoform X2 [Chenopodium quinoa]|uniref:F-box protein SKIP23-like isoform X2 n=1 Tax=Chenopodium quinoa TaxID=63459 RepID=UPI000B78EA2A|nr:F-box protein SKIP23-like isoform X2 [Chenopodium quinoa]
MNQETPSKKVTEVDWSELPKELLGEIAKCFPEFSDDYRHFRGVCKNWRESCTSPFTIFLPGFPLKIPTYLGKTVVLITSFVYILRRPIHKPSSIAWIIQVDDLKPNKLQVRHPITNNRLDISNLPESFKLNDYSPEPYDMSYKLRFVDGDDDLFDSRIYNWRNYPVKTKSILLEAGVVVVLSLGQGGMLGLMRTNGEWKFTSLGYNPRFDDIEKFKGNVCALTRYGKAFLINGDDGKVIEVISEPLDSSEVGDRRKLLMEYDDELYMIGRGDTEFKVFKLNEELHKWERVTTFGDQILFVSYDKCFFVEADYLPVWERDCILFPKHCFPNNAGDYVVDGGLFQGATRHLEIGVFSMVENSFQPISFYPDLCKLFWPIPSWILSDASSSSSKNANILTPPASSSGSDGDSEEDEGQNGSEPEEDEEQSGSESEEDEEQHGLEPEENEEQSGSESSSEEESDSESSSQHGENESAVEESSSPLDQINTSLEEVSGENNGTSVSAMNSPHQGPVKGVSPFGIAL